MAVISTIVDVLAGQSSNGDVVVSPGQFVVFAGGTIVSTEVGNVGKTLISAGGSATGTTLQNDGLQVVEGTAVGTLVASNGEELVISGGVTSGATIFAGGLELIGPIPGEGAGSAVGMTVNRGTAGIFSDGAAAGTSVINGGILVVESGGMDSDASVGTGGTVDVLSGGIDSGASVAGGTLNISGGTADHTSVGTGGTMNVSSGATADHTSVGSGGTLTVSSGGVVSALTIKDPNDPGVTAVANVLSGGTVDGSTKINGGILTLDAGAVFQPHAALTIVNNGWLLLEQDSFKGAIHDFGGQDFMDLTKIKFIGQETTATFTQTSGAGGILQVAQGNHVVDLHLTGTYTTANFALASDGAHGTLVSFVPSASLAGHG